jgi:hypothetical protein
MMMILQHPVIDFCNCWGGGGREIAKRRTQGAGRQAERLRAVSGQSEVMDYTGT